MQTSVTVAKPCMCFSGKSPEFNLDTLKINGRVFMASLLFRYCTHSKFLQNNQNHI